MTEEQEHYCEVETIKCPHYPTVVALSLETGASPADILAAVNRRRPRFGGFLICTGHGEVSLYTDRHVRQAAAMLQAGRGWSAVWEALNLQHTSKGKKEMRSKIEALLADRRDEITADIAGGMSAAKMGKKYGVSGQTIINMKNRMLDELAQAADESNGAVPAGGSGSAGAAKATAAVTAEELRRASELIAAVPELSAPTSVRIGAEGNAVHTDIGGNGWLLTLTVSGAEGKGSGGAK